MNGSREGPNWFMGIRAVGRKAAAVRPHKAQHDQEQRAYLAGDDALDDAAVSEQFHLEHGARLAGSTINLRNDIGEIEEQWRTNKPQIVVIDNLLNPTALEELRRLLLGLDDLAGGL